MDDARRKQRLRMSMRIVKMCSLVLIVLGIAGAIFAQDRLQREAQFLTIGMGAVGLLMALVIIPRLTRHADSRRTE